MEIKILEKCPCCGNGVDLSLPENRGLVINRKASLGAQIVLTKEMIERAKGTSKLDLENRLVDLEKDLQSLNNFVT